MASHEARVKRVQRCILRELAVTPQGARRTAKAILAELPVRELMGARELAELLEVDVSNLRSVSGLPAPVGELRATRVWDAEECRRFARARARRRALL